MSETMRSAAGSLLVVGLGGTELTGLERAWLKLVRPAGIYGRRCCDGDTPTGAARVYRRSFQGSCTRSRKGIAPLSGEPAAIAGAVAP